MCIQRWLCLAVMAGLCGGAELSHAAVTVGFATPMDKVMIEGAVRGWPFEGVIADSYSLSLARREHEAFQVVVMPTTALTNARVSVSPLTNVANGTPLAGAVEVSLVGHVNVGDAPHNPAQYPSYLIGYTGWYPDAILTFKQTASINANDRVAFWVDVAASTTAVPGDYAATITVTADGIAAISKQLNVHVWDIELPFRPRLQTAFSCELTTAKTFYPTGFNAIRYAYYDVLLAHRVSPTELYRTSDPVPQEFIDYWVANGANAFGLGKVPKIPVANFSTVVSYLQSAGLLDMAYIYGYDEVSTQTDFDKIYYKFGEIHRTYPGLRTFTTARDYSFGTSPNTTYLRDVVDVWCVQQPYYNVAAGEALRSEGKELWWYNTAFPAYPWANWVIEYPAIEARMLMGAMAYKFKTDGHLYWAIDKYANNTAPIPSSTGVYMTWDPRSAQHTSSGEWVDGDGCLVLPGVNGPIPTLRLANIRDGLEDYDYLALLSDTVAAIRALPPTSARTAFLAQADALLAVPASVVSSFTSFTRDSASLYSYRQQLAAAILSGRVLLSSSPGDFDGDGDVDLADFGVFAACSTGPGLPYDPAHLPAGCTLTATAGFIDADFDQDGDVDSADFGTLQRSYAP